METDVEIVVCGRYAMDVRDTGSVIDTIRLARDCQPHFQS
ncbi:hypothetical protein SAMN05216356_12213 [Oribacterium sp. WCC10]|nr:hypothetical protein SAMN05216356_12213 [Oribacterium sp. WCC10]